MIYSKQNDYLCTRCQAGRFGVNRLTHENQKNEEKLW